LRRSSRTIVGLAAAALAASLLPGCGGGSRGHSPLVLSEDIFTEAPFAQCHASTIVATPSGLVAAWFGGTAEGAPDVGIWTSRKTRAGWTAPVEIAHGNGRDGKPEPCWNPVLFRPSRGPLLLFYKSGPSPSGWRGLVMRSRDDGKTWDKPEPLPEGFVGPVKNHPLELADGTILCGSSTESDGWRVHFEMSRDLGATWTRTPAINEGRAPGLIQPALLRDGERGILALMRSDAGRIYESRSADAGATWTAPAPTVFPNPNSGLDAVTLRDGRHVLVYNPVTAGRGILAVAVFEKGSGWRRVLTFEEEKDAEFSYPAVIQTPDRLVHITYTWKRQRIRHAVVDPAAFPPPREPWRPGAGGEVCVIETNYGQMAFELFDEDAPKTVAQFRELVRRGFYYGKDFYRVVKGHVIQAGDGGAPPLPPELNTRPHLFGTLGLGRVGDEWSGDSEIYVCVAPRPHLDGRYAVFGQIVEGGEVLSRIAKVPVEERWEGPDKKMAMHKPLEPVVIRWVRIEHRFGLVEMWDR
jgi:predicted neuraminidase/cyclophilin family peptidyl-prolyl cis-trans isomerase